MNDWAYPRRGTSPIVTCFPKHGQQARIPFVGFAEAYALKALRNAGVPLQRIRPAVELLRHEIGLEYALASRNLYTDGVDVLYQYADDQPDLTVVTTKQRQFRKVIEQYLKRISFGEDSWAERVQLPIYEVAKVSVDPHVAFGHPVLRRGRARVEDIVDRFAAGDTIKDLAFDFRVSAAEIEDLIRVEARPTQTPPKWAAAA